jgi:putative transcriptional regulator
VSETPANLAGQLLIAEPRLSDPNFRRSVVLVLAHDAEGALGVVLNRPTEVPACEVVEELASLVDASDMLHDGGPVQRDGVVVLADFAEPEESERLVVGSVGMLSDLSEPERLSESVRRVRAFAGYAGWGAGQLEGEIDGGDWYIVPSQPPDAFQADPTDLWREVMRRQPGELAWHLNRPVDPELN